MLFFEIKTEAPEMASSVVKSLTVMVCVHAKTPNNAQSIVRKIFFINNKLRVNTRSAQIQCEFENIGTSIHREVVRELSILPNLEDEN